MGSGLVTHAQAEVPALTIDLLDSLRAFDTPTVCNALELVDPTRRGTGFSTRPFVCAFPSLAPIVGITLGIGKLPHAVLIDAEGVIRSSGIVNSREHLESLLVAQETGWASMQDYLTGARPPQRNGTSAVPNEVGSVSA